MSEKNNSYIRFKMPDGSTIEMPNLQHIKLPDYSGVFEAAQKFNQQMQPILESYKNFYSNIEPTVHAALNSFSSVYENVQNALKNIDFEALHKQARKYSNVFNRVKLIMIEIGFPIHPDYWYANPARIIEIYDEKGVEYTKKLITRYMHFVFNNSLLDDIKGKWLNNSWIEKRSPILAQIIDAHKSKLYAPAITTAFSQIEGILTDGILNINPKKSKVSTKDQKDFLNANLLDTSNDNIFNMDQIIHNLFEKTIYAQFKLGQPLNSDLSRHAVLHGYDLTYSNKTNSLQLIILLDTLINKITPSNVKSAI